jgi:hypothetical protein
VQKPHNINVKYIDSISDWPHNLPVAKRKENFRHFNAYMVLSIHLAMDWNDMNQQLIHGNLPYITLLLIGQKLTTH